MSYSALIPFSTIWFSAILVLIVAVRPDSIPVEGRAVLTSWLGLGGLFGTGIFIFVKEPILGTAVFILMFALLAEKHKRFNRENFTSEIQTDVVTSNKKWLVEKILDERPIAISDKTVTTYPASN
jgi:uncharacterized membrane protein